MKKPDVLRRVFILLSVEVASSIGTPLLSLSTVAIKISDSLLGQLSVSADSLVSTQLSQNRLICHASMLAKDS